MLHEKKNICDHGSERLRVPNHHHAGQLLALLLRGQLLSREGLCGGAVVAQEKSSIDVAVDIRKGSPTYGQHVAVELSEENHRQFFVPRGFAHGFAVLSETAVFQYKCDNFYAPEADGGISIVDGSLGIDWKINADRVLLSEKDTKHAFLKDFDSPFDINIDLYPEFK